MGFFKKVTGGLKKFVKKNVRFSNLVKLGALADPSGILSGIQANKEAKKEQQRAEHEALQEQQAYQNLSNTEKVNLVSDNVTAKNIAMNPSFMDIIKGAGAGALTGAGSVLGGGKTVGDIGASVVDSTISSWFKTNWLKLIGGTTALILLIWGLPKLLRPKRYGRR